MLTLHAYRSWMPDHPRGFVKDGQIRPSDRRMGDRYREAARDEPVWFSPAQLELLHSGALDIAAHRHWRVHAVFGEPTHLHVVLTWQWAKGPDEVKRIYSNVLSLFLGELAGERGRRWFVRRPSFRPVRDAAHLAHLVGAYRAKHRALAWREGDPLPPALGVLLPARASARGS